MEIPMINRISDFEAGISPSFLSQLFALSGIEKIYLQAFNFWKWGALILALLASFTTIINKLKILIIRLRRNNSRQSQQLLDDSDFDTETDASYSSSSGSEDEQENEAPSTSSNWRRWRPVDENFCVRGSGHYIDDHWQNNRFTLRKRCGSIGDLFQLSDLVTSGKSVVKLWDNIALGFFDDSDDEDFFNVYDINREQKPSSIFAGNRKVQAVSASSSSSPAVVVSAGADLSGRVALRAWDTRLPCRAPSILAEWKPNKPAENVAAVNAGGVEKVYVRDDVTGELTVGDMRKTSSPIAKLTESDVETWWDADAVIVADE